MRDIRKVLCLSVTVLVLGCSFVGCSHAEQSDSKESNIVKEVKKPVIDEKLTYGEGEHYITMTATRQISERKLESQVYLYSIEKSKLVKKFTFEDRSQYSLSCIDINRNCVFYVAPYSNNGDQIYSYDMESEKITRITDDFYAINYIMPDKSGMYIVGCKSGEHNIDLFYYDFSQRKIKKIQIEKDFFLELFYYDVDKDKVYVSGYNNKEFEKYRDTKKTQDSYLYQIDTSDNSVKRIFRAKNKTITSFYTKGKDICCIMQKKRNSLEEKPVFYYQNLTKKGSTKNMTQEKLMKLRDGTYIDAKKNIYTHYNGKLVAFTDGFQMKQEKSIYQVSSNEAINNIQAMKVYNKREVVALPDVLEANLSNETIQLSASEQKNLQEFQDCISKVESKTNEKNRVTDQEVLEQMNVFLDKENKKYNKGLYYKIMSVKNDIVLMIADSTCVAKSSHSAIKAEIYRYVDGDFKYITKLCSMGSSYPITYKNGAFMVGAHHYSQLYFWNGRKMDVYKMGVNNGKAYANKSTIAKKKKKLFNICIAQEDVIDLYYDRDIEKVRGKEIHFTKWRKK